MSEENIVFDNVSKFYGEILGINRVNLSIPPGITGLVGPNGSGKSTLMNLLTGLLLPTEGDISVLGHDPSDPEILADLGYCTQYDAFPPGLTGYSFVYSFLRVRGFTHDEADEMTWWALDKVGLTDAARRKVGGYSKGMRQRARVAQGISHRPRILVLDEPLNGLDPMARAEITSVFQEMGDAGAHILISSHILNEVDMFSDQVVLLTGGYVVAEGDIHGVRHEVEEEHPIQVLVACDKAAEVATSLFEKRAVTEASLSDDGGGVLVRTRNSKRFYLTLNEVIMKHDVAIETVKVADDDVRAVYQYLIGDERQAR